MKAKYLAAVPILILTLVFISVETRAQDEVPGPDVNSFNTVEPNDYDEKPLLYEPEGRTSRQAVTDSVQSKPAVIKKAAPVPEAKKSKEESDPLNFNFLFYIIQTFKSSDLMMEE